ncbi:LLM class flavin-dependent oxidoreductase [Streptomyces sp. NPDC097727]|uniref:LLM class flavin-dependent oxidoreductase n=1 Tax=Streptomyces sp. NPDC097727 TaxID=3366092 RepID=UPI0038284108
MYEFNVKHVSTNFQYSTNRPSGIPLSVVDLMPFPKGHSATRTMSDTLAVARAADAAGYHRYWIAEHHNAAGLASSATVVVIAEVAAATERIRVGAGGIMLPNHTPYVVAEQFGTLAAFHPGRIDLGLGRAPGTDPWTVRALRRGTGADDFPREVAQVREYLGPARPTQRVRAIPGQGSEVPVFILGSSTFGAALAAQEGLPYVFASHFAPDQLLLALDTYRSNFRPSAVLDKPYAIVAAGTVVAETDEKARHLFTAMQRRFLTLVRGNMEFLPPVEDIDAIWTPAEREAVGAMLRESHVGSPAAVRKSLAELVERTRADELILMSETWDLEDRIRSYELLAEAWHA